jgi:hypothetical protein
MAKDDLHFRLRIPDDLKGKVQAAARDNHRSITAEIITRLSDSFNDGANPDHDMLRDISSKLDILIERSGISKNIPD